MKRPQMYRVEQMFDATHVPHIRRAVVEALENLSPAVVKSGQRVAITAGSRGIRGIAEIMRAVVDYFRRQGAVPFIFPAMGSHGGATAEGQIAVLDRLGISEAFVPAPIQSSMETVTVGRTPDGVPVYVDHNALGADHIVVVNRIKSHTKFKAPIESGLMKMMAIGMGKQKGAVLCHKAAVEYGMARIIVDAAREIIRRTPILCGVGVVENGYGDTAGIRAFAAADIEAGEEKLLRRAKQMAAKLPLNDIDVLIVDQMGKDISGVGMDPNVTGRNRDLLGVFPHPTRIKRIFVRDLSDQSYGNANGIGLADVTTRRLVEKIDYQATYQNAVTAMGLEKAAVPMHFDTDEAALSAALNSIGLVPPARSRIVRIRHTGDLKVVEVSAACLPQLAKNTRILAGPQPLAFDPL